MEDGRPFLDMSHVIANLNKLDTGVPDQVEIVEKKDTYRFSHFLS